MAGVKHRFFEAAGKEWRSSRDGWAGMRAHLAGEHLRSAGLVGVAPVLHADVAEPNTGR